MNKSLVSRLLVLWMITLSGLWIAGVSKFWLGVGVVLLGLLAFLGMSLKSDEAPAPINEPKAEPQRYFVDQTVVVYLYDGRKIKGKISQGVSYEAPGASLLVKDAQVTEADQDVGDSPTSEDIHDEVLIQIDQIIFVARDNLDRVPS